MNDVPSPRYAVAPVTPFAHRRRLPVLPVDARPADAPPSDGSPLPGSEHLRFRCNGCGDCCRQLRVALTHHDLRRLSEGLGQWAGALVDWLTPADVDMTGEPGSFVRLTRGRRLMVLAQDEGSCRLLTPDQRCSAYAVRPLDCRLFPFDLEHDAQGRPLRLARLDANCGDEQGPAAPLDELSIEDAQRWRELADYQQKLQLWNRMAEHRARSGRRPGDTADFLAFLGFARAPSPPP
jgi:Fe-S-cluster containining protein